MYTIVYQCTGWSPCPFGLLLVLLVFVLSNGPLSVFCGGTSLKCQKPIVCDVSAVVLLSYCLHWSRHALQAHPPNVGQPNICPQKGWSCTLCQCGSKRCFPNGRKLCNFLDPPLLQASCGDSMPSFHASEGHLLQHCIVEYTHTPSYTQKRGYGRGSKHLEIPCFSPQNSFYPVDVHPILIPRGPCSAPPNAGGRPKGTAGADLSHFVSKEKAAPREPIYKLRLKTRT